MAASSSPRIQGHKPIDISSTLRSNPNSDISEEEFAKTTAYVNAIENYLTPKFHHYSRHTFPIDRSFLARRKEEVTSGYIFLDRITNEPTQKLPVKFGISLDGRAVVVKSLTAGQVRKTEIAIQKKLRQLDPEKNYYIVGPIVTYRNHHGIRKIAQILDLKQGGDLLDYFNHHLAAKGELSNKLIYPIAYKMARMLSILHKNGIVHLDVKLENFLMENDEVFLSDFGHSHFTERRLRQVWGSPGYQDPTSFFKEKKIKAKPEMDVWSMGICLSILKHGAEFQRWMGQMDGNFTKLAAMDEIEFSWAKAKYLPNRWNPDSLDYIINQCLTLDPKARPTAEAVSEFVLELIQKRKTLP